MAAIETSAALLTPHGRGALATIRVCGPRAWQVTNACLTKPIGTDRSASVAALARHEQSLLMRPWMREFRGAEGPGEELVVCFPHEHEARIHCHGGTAACEAVLSALEKQGAIRQGEAPAEPSAARTALADALTEKTALILLDQLQGAWTREIETIIGMIEQSQPAAALARIETLLSRAPLGQRLTQPWQVVLAGRPNAGKSSLLNALLGFQRSITSPEPGTTRDVVTARTAFDGWPVELRDTAGLRTTGDAIELVGVELAERELHEADLVLYLIPATEIDDEARTQTQEIERLRGNRPLLVVVTKIDLIDLHSLEHSVGVSSVTGHGLAELAAAIVQQLIGVPPEPDAAVPFLREHEEALRDVLDALSAGAVHFATQRLCEVTA